MMKQLAFRQVDVFTRVPFKGNPVAVVFDADSLGTQQMQAIANWTNLSETTFICAPRDRAADYRLRIFTPKRELAFAGHPTIGSAHAVLEQGIRPKTAGRLVQECGAGLVALTIEKERLFLTLPQAALREVDEPLAGEIAAALGIAADAVLAKAVVDVGVSWITLQLAGADRVRSLQPDLARIAALTPRSTAGVTVFGLAPGTVETQIEVRSFAPADGVPEDPVCGSGNGCVAALIRQENLLGTSGYVASQGGCLGRDGRVEVQYRDDGTILLGGHAVTCVEGSLATP
ncbi:MAG: PhzF family phenazine biosynthesis protein [Burkholderiales bacterium]